MEYEELKLAVDKLGKEYIAELAIQLADADKVASGKLLRSLNYYVIEVLGNFMIQVISGSYLEYVDRGRKPGKQPPQSAIKKWIDIRGISPDKGMTKDGLAFVIARSIGRKGIQPTGVIKKSMANVMKSKEILSKAAGKDVEKYIKNILINI
jgi:hypothetical protein